MLTLPLLLALTGCNLLELTPTSQVVRARVAGVEAEPAEIGLGESTTLRSLLVHPPAQTPALGQIWFACLETESAGGCLGFDLAGAIDGEGDDDDDATDPPDLQSGDVQFGIGETFEYTAEGPLLEEAWAALDPADRVEGLTLLVAVNYVERSNEELTSLLIALGTALQTGNQENLDLLVDEFTGLLDNSITAARRVVISDKSAGAPSPVECPVSELAPNQNPEFVGLTVHADRSGFDEGFPLGPVTFVRPEESLTLRPQLGEDARENYLFIDRNAVTHCRREDPYFAWVASGGASMSSDYSFVAEEGDLEEVEGRPKVNRITMPPAEEFPAEGVDLWVVLRDRRGGLVWTERRFLQYDTP
ncbi:MAG: hypothetical protein KDA24_02180 [Deltaproteobacteria bacterium]|nr:hypothetical protein [Deltaproteobacteria bacterium]